MTTQPKAPATTYGDLLAAIQPAGGGRVIKDPATG
jgi:hypothetical protein